MYWCFLLGLALVVVSPLNGSVLELQQNACPNFWYSFKGRCYKYVGRQMTWADAELHCLSEGGNLVSIHSLEEHNFVNFMIKSFDPSQTFTWIGLSDIHKEGSWMWSDGSKVDFRYWDAGQPDNAGGNEHCGHTNMFTFHKWNDYVCSNTYAFVCAKEKDCK
ncbi:PREDICTED: lactose-binding lectin l-2-like [Cyprinodon variegatus]|uniref:lactose-binding lectin l-2-like n=1 Tax=Cyprinodon variegatus TaxID=28743 RepID=UPI0007426190|nr:PREDICTED: lactose-binding lectin l-2-like [Cyprinodon variegatus]